MCTVYTIEEPNQGATDINMYGKVPADRMSLADQDPLDRGTDLDPSIIK